MRLLNDASITAKSLISTLVGAIFLVAMAAVAIVSLVEIQHANDAAGRASAMRAGARGAVGDLARGHAALYRAINLKSQNVEVRIVRVARTDFSQAIDSAKSGLGAVRLTGLPIDPQLLTDAVKAFDQYAEAANQAASFVEDDAFNATMFMTDAQQKYDIALQSAAALLKAGSAVAAVMEDQSDAAVRNALLVIPIAAVAAVLLSAMATTWLSRLISRPILAMTASMRRLADGDLTTEVASLDRRDEVGQMAQTLLVFRSNALEARALQAAADQENAGKARRQVAMDRCTRDFGAGSARPRRCGGLRSKCRKPLNARASMRRTRPKAPCNRRATSARSRRLPNKCRPASPKSASRSPTQPRQRRRRSSEPRPPTRRSPIWPRRRTGSVMLCN
jgi:hypothetical protein